jgi:hypothetical protein
MQLNNLILAKKNHQVVHKSESNLENFLYNGDAIADPTPTYIFWDPGWALKSAQKYGKKGGGKHISKKV